MAKSAFSAACVEKSATREKLGPHEKKWEKKNKRKNPCVHQRSLHKCNWPNFPQSVYFNDLISVFDWRLREQDLSIQWGKTNNEINFQERKESNLKER